MAETGKRIGGETEPVLLQDWRDLGVRLTHIQTY